MPNLTFSKLWKIIYFLLVFGLFFSVIKSGYGYTYDNDEIMHVQKIFLLATGYKPYVNFFSIFSPIFHVLLMPVFLLFGFNLGTIHIVRAIMIGLFIMRLVLTLFVLDKVFGRKLVYFFLPMFLLDQNAVFAGMQIRPDNLMLLFFVIGLVFLILSEKQKPLFLFFSGIFLSLSVLTLIKIVPSLLVFFIIYLIVCLRRRQLLPFFYVLNGFLLPICLFLAYFLVNGSLVPAIQQIFIYPKLLTDTMLHSVPFGYFFTPNYNLPWLQSGKPFVFIYTVILPYLAFLGGTLLFIDRFSYVKFILLFLLIFQAISLLAVKAVFVQYYLPITWLMTLFAAVFIHKIVDGVKNKQIKTILNLISFIYISFIFVTIDNIKVNIARSETGPKDFEARMTYLWSQIPPNVYVFPSLLFRRPAYPLICCYILGKNMPDMILNKFPPVEQVLEINKVKYLLLSDYSFSFLQYKASEYIKSNYHRVGEDPELWVRNSPLTN